MTCPHCGSGDLRDPKLRPGTRTLFEVCRECQRSFNTEPAKLRVHVLMARHHLTRREIETVYEAADRMVDAAFTTPRYNANKAKPAYQGETADDVVRRVTHDWRRQCTLLSIAGSIETERISESDEMTWAKTKRKERRDQLEAEGEDRPRHAIEVARAHARGEATDAELADASEDAWCAADAAGDAAARAAADPPARHITMAAVAAAVAAADATAEAAGGAAADAARSPPRSQDQEGLP
ncbi:hypothetical protein BH23CHL8_BH23CHL8_32140 [soil metagenome]